MKLITIFVLSLTLTACSACNRKPVSAPSTGSSATVTVEGDKVTTTTKDPNGKLITVISQTKQPDLYPKDIPAFPEGRDSKYQYTSEGAHITLEIYSSKGPREVAEYFEHELSASGWTANITTGQDKVSTVKADKDGRQVEVRVSPYDTGSSVQLIYNAKS